MLFPAIPNSPPATSSQQSKSVEPEKTPEEDRVEPSKFEDAILWFQSLNKNPEAAPLPESELSVDVPQSEIEQGTAVDIVLGSVKQSETSQQPLTPPPGLETATPEITQPAQELTVEKFDELAESIESTEESADEATSKEASGSESSSSFSQEGDSTPHFDSTKSASRNEPSAQTTSVPSVNAKQDIEGPNTAQNSQNLDVNSNPNAANEIVETSFSDVVKVASKPAQSVTQQVVEQTLAQLATTSGKQDSSFTIRLDPPELGEVLVRLKKSEGGIIMRVAAVEKSTQALLQLNEADLSQSMADLPSDVTMEFGSQSDFENSKFSQKETLAARRAFESKSPSDSSTTILLQASQQDQSPHNFTA